MVRVTVRNAAGLRELADNLGSIDEARKVIVDNWAEEAVDLVKEQFRKGTDPYGAPWAKPKCRKGKPLMDSGALRNSLHVASRTVRSFTIAFGLFTAEVHNFGKVIKAKNDWIQIYTTRTGKQVARAMPPLLRFKCAHGWHIAKEVTIPVRKLLPNKGRLPRKWKRAFKDIVDDALEEYLG
jgi:phage gpG-like protein